MADPLHPRSSENIQRKIRHKFTKWRATESKHCVFPKQTTDINDIFTKIWQTTHRTFSFSSQKTREITWMPEGVREQIHWKQKRRLFEIAVRSRKLKPTKGHSDDILAILQRPAELPVVDDADFGKNQTDEREHRINQKFIQKHSVKKQVVEIKTYPADWFRHK